MITLDQGVVIAGRYTLVRPLAKGGMGSVWIARHRDLEIDVTVKFMAPALVAEAEARMRFEREAKVAARLRSQYVVQVHDYGVEDETPYIIMELLKGESLSTRIEREGRLPLPTMARLLIQICKALRTAHEAGLVHRDLKPGNVFLALKDDEEVVKVLDFGIAKTGTLGEAQADTDSGVLLGSVHYMSPEQIRSSRSVDHRSDLWSVAVILYRVLTGRLPFPGANLGDVLVRVCTDAAPKPSSAAPDLPSLLDGFFERALARDPDQRFQSAPELAEAFASLALVERASIPAAIAPTPDVIAPPSPVIAKDLPAAPPPPQAPAPPPVAAAPPIELTVRMATTPAIPAVEPPPPHFPIGVPATQWDPGGIESPIPYPTLMPRSGTIPADPRPQIVVDPASRAIDPTVAAPASGRSSWPVWAVAATVTLALIGGLALRSRATSSVVDATLAPSASPPVDTAPAPSAAGSLALALALGPGVATAPVASAAGPRASAAPRPPIPSAAPPRAFPRPRHNPLDRSD